jgi:hypothetical protein
MKKRIIISLGLIFVTVFLAACGSMTTVNPIKSKIFEDEDYQAAVECLNEYFGDWEGCTMKEISYAGDDVVYAEAEARGVAPDCLIVLKTTFETDGEDRANGLEPNYTYEDYTWTFERTDFTMPWEHVDHGYG